MPDSLECCFAPSAGFAVESSCFSDFSSSVYAPGNCFAASDRSLAAASASRVSDQLPLNTSSLYGAESKSSFDANKSVQQQITEGKFKQSESPAPAHSELKSDEQPKISITNDTKKAADFTVKKDGTVEVHGNPESGKPFSEYKIAVEKGADQKVTDALAGYLRDRLLKSGDSIKPSLFAEPGLVSDGLRKSFNKENESDNLDPEKDPYDGGGGGGGGGCGGGGGGGRDGGAEDLDNKNLPDDKPDPNRNDRQTDSISSLDALRQSMIASSDASGNPNWENATAGALGAYSMDAVPWFADHLTGEMLGELEEIDPKTGKKIFNWRKLASVMAKHKDDPNFKALMDEHSSALKEQGDEQSATALQTLMGRLQKDEKFAEGFGSFLQNQQDRKNATPDEMKNYFSKDIQQAAISSQMADAAKKLDIQMKNMNEKQAGDLALALTMGAKANAMDKQTLANELERLRKDPLYASFLEQSILKFKKAKQK